MKFRMARLSNHVACAFVHVLVFSGFSLLSSQCVALWILSDALLIPCLPSYSTSACLRFNLMLSRCLCSYRRACGIRLCQNFSISIFSGMLKGEASTPSLTSMLWIRITLIEMTFVALEADALIFFLEIIKSLSLHVKVPFVGMSVVSVHGVYNSISLTSDIIGFGWCWLVNIVFFRFYIAWPLYLGLLVAISTSGMKRKAMFLSCNYGPSSSSQIRQGRGKD